MTRFEQTVVVNQPAGRVFGFVSDLENDPIWSGVAGMRRTSSGAVGIGTTFVQSARFLRRSMDLVFEVTEFEPGHRLTIRAAYGPLALFGERIVEPAGNAASRVTFVGGGRASGILRLAEPALSALGAHGQRRMLTRLKQTLEAPAATGAARPPT